MEGDIMIDKITAYTREFSIDGDAELEIVPCSIDNNSGEELNSTVLWWNGFNPVCGRRAFINRHGVNITIENGRLTFSFNPSSIQFSNNFKIINYDEFKESLKRVEIILSALGIHINLDTCKLSRVDLCCNIEVNHDVNLYRSALQIISPKYMSKKHVLLADGSYTVRNKSRQYIFYDKVKQMKSKGIDLEAFEVKTRNIMRCEVRLMNHRSVENSITVGTLGELLVKATYANVKDIFKKIMKDDFFRMQDLKDTSPTIHTDSDLVCQIRIAYPKKAIDLFFIYKQLTGEAPYPLPDLITVMTTCGYAPSTILERRRQISEVLQIGREYHRDGLRTTDLISEMLLKILES
jgi:hypothetical protein